MLNKILLVIFTDVSCYVLSWDSFDFYRSTNSRLPSHHSAVHHVQVDEPHSTRLHLLTHKEFKLETFGLNWVFWGFLCIINSRKAWWPLLKPGQWQRHDDTTSHLLHHTHKHTNTQLPTKEPWRHKSNCYCCIRCCNSGWCASAQRKKSSPCSDKKMRQRWWWIHFPRRQNSRVCMCLCFVCKLMLSHGCGNPKCSILNK